MNVFNRTNTKQQHSEQTQSRGECDSDDELHKSYIVIDKMMTNVWSD